MANFLHTARSYARLTKPGVLVGNVLTALAGYFLVTSQNSFASFDWANFLAMCIGMTLVVGGACALNNYLDRDIDAKMERTKDRPSVSGNLSPLGMFMFAWILFIAGTAILALWTNTLTVIVGVLGFVTYVWFYGAWTKRTSIHGTAVGAVSGALPIAGGYAAASGVVDAGLVISFLIMFFWQFPEFYSIAIYRRKEYAAAKVPVMPVVVGVRSTIIQIFAYTILYVASTLALVSFGYAGVSYAIIMGAAGAYWIYLGYKGLRVNEKQADVWARSMFRFSMIVILLLCLMLSIGALLP